MDAQIKHGPAHEHDGDGLIVGLLLDGKGGARSIGWDEIRAWTPEAGVLWLHLNRTKEDAEHYIRREAGLDEVVVESLLAPDTRPRVAPQGPGLIVNLRGVNFNPGADPEDMISMRLWIQKRRIITTRARRLMATRDVEERLARGAGPKDEIDCLFELAQSLLRRVGHVNGRALQRSAPAACWAAYSDRKAAATVAVSQYSRHLMILPAASVMAWTQ